MQRNDKGQFVATDDKTVESEELQELLGVYLSALQSIKRDTRQSTLDTRRREVRYWLAYCERNDIDPLAATTDDVRGYIQSIRSKGDHTITSYYASVQSFYSVLAKDQEHDVTLEHDHPCDEDSGISLSDDYDISRTSEYQRQQKLTGKEVDGSRDNDTVLALKPDKIEELFNNVPGETKETQLRNEIAVKLNWFTGCRSDELERLRIENIDWDQCTIDLRSSKLTARDHPELIRRDVMFPESFKYQLKRWCERVRHAFSTGVDIDDDDEITGHILVSQHNDHMESWHINDIVKEAAHNAGIQQPLRPANPSSDEEVEEWVVTTHRIRRSAISHWVNDCEQLDLHQVRRLAGHSQIDQTMHYLEDDEEQIRSDYQSAMS